MDSSSDDEGEYTTTNVTLGYASHESTGDVISHIGGHPTWLDDKFTPPATIVKCKSCDGLTSLLLQLNADLQAHFPYDDRRLHVFCCTKKACSRKIGSVRAFREVRKPLARSKPASKVSEIESEHPPPGLGTALFGGDGLPPKSNTFNPFSTSQSPPEQMPNPFSALLSTSSLAAVPPQRPIDPPSLTETFAEKLKISNPQPPAQEKTHDPWPPKESFPAPFQSYHLDADAEELEPENSGHPKMSGPSKTQYDLEDTPTNESGKDSFESSIDKIFQKFSDRIAQNPEQVLRYEFKGQPLLYSGTDDVSTRFIVPHGKVGATRGIPRCEHCGAQRVFELQLVPGLIYELEKNKAMDFDDGMEWGTIIVGTCANNCGESGAVTFREEWVGVQLEERILKK